MKKLTSLALISVALTEASVAAGYVTNFNAGYDTSQQLAGQDGWQISDPTPNLSFFTTWNTSTSGAVGGYYDAPIGVEVDLTHDVGVPLSGASFDVDLGVQTSTALFPGRDAFGFTMFNPGGTSLVTFRFEPDPVDTTLLNITWSSGGGPATTTGWAILYDGPYHLEADFTGAGADVQFAATVSSGINSMNFNGLLPGLGGETFDAVGANFLVRGAAAGDNFMTFDNVAAVPEPTTGVLVSLLLGASLLRRKKAEKLKS